jgi:putative FmdB family regulatory protein
MPMFEYVCRACGERFEKLVFSSQIPVGCPVCESSDLEKQFSVFGMGSGGRAPGSVSVPMGGG